MSFTLKPHPSFPGRPGPLVLVVMDGVGIGRGDESDAVTLARTPTLDALRRGPLSTTLRAHGTAVGLPSDGDMGNSEVGHNALGAGRVYDQGAKLVSRALEDGSLFRGETWQRLMARPAVHFIGLLSDGNVHSHIAHLEAMLRAAAGKTRVYLHALLDGRDVPATSALTYVDRIERVLAEVGGKIASGGGRMWITMDRYEADWAMVERGWHTHVLGQGRRFASARQAIETFRGESPGIGDQNLPAFVIEGAPPIVDGDGVVFFNFRGDRAIEISRAFDDETFTKFDRVRRPDVLFAGMMEYDGDFHIPRHFLVPPPAIERTMGEYLAKNGVTQLAISETQKFGHVTYFWNGNRGGMFDERRETYVEVPSDLRPFQERPWMKAAEITDRLIDELRTGKHRLARVNFPNGDMVGHTGHHHATVAAVEAVDLQLARLVREVELLGGVLVVTADHGNAEEMYEQAKGTIQRDPVTGVPVAKTSHTLNPVPFVVHDPRYVAGEYVAESGGGLANVTAAAISLLGFAPPDDMAPSVLKFR